MEKGHNFNRVRGTEEEEKEVTKKLKDLYEDKDKSFPLKKYEVVKTPEEIQLIKKTENIVNKMVVSYGGQPSVLPLDNIVVVNSDDVSLGTDGVFRRGFHSPLAQHIVVERQKANFLFASTMAHEMFHLKSFKSAFIKEGELGLYRSGLEMIDIKDKNKNLGEEKEYFSVLEEAVVAECTIKFLEELSKDKDFSEEAQALSNFKKWVINFHKKTPNYKGTPDKELENEIKYVFNPKDVESKILLYSEKQEEREAYAAGLFNGFYEKGDLEITERYFERNKLYSLLDKIIDTSNGKFSTRDQIFDEFAKANFSGNYIPLARIIESCLGVGSFRNIAEEFSRE